MFLTVTLNPALDKTLFIDRNSPKVTVRASRVADLAGGKGVNVARALRSLVVGQGEVLALLPSGGHSGAHLVSLAHAEGLDVVAVPIEGQTRTALTIQEEATGEYWHYLEPGPELSPAEMSRLKASFDRILPARHTVVISGSLPSAGAAPLVAWVLERAKAAGKRVALDSFGPLLKESLLAGAWLVKPNLEELEATLGVRLSSVGERFEALEQAAARGTALAVLSLGAEGALAVAAGRRWQIHPPAVVEVNDLGGGDSMVAGICWAAAVGYSTEDCLRWGAACGAANAAVWDPGGFTRADAERLLPQVRLEKC
jgi:1-phosphofructokinase family hexose kinase